MFNIIKTPRNYFTRELLHRTCSAGSALPLWIQTARRCTVDEIIERHESDETSDFPSTVTASFCGLHDMKNDVGLGVFIRSQLTNVDKLKERLRSSRASPIKRLIRGEVVNNVRDGVKHYILTTCVTVLYDYGQTDRNVAFHKVVHKHTSGYVEIIKILLQI